MARQGGAPRVKHRAPALILGALILVAAVQTLTLDLWLPPILESTGLGKHAQHLKTSNISTVLKLERNAASRALVAYLWEQKAAKQQYSRLSMAGSNSLVVAPDSAPKRQPQAHLSGSTTTNQTQTATHSGHPPKTDDPKTEAAETEGLPEYLRNLLLEIEKEKRKGTLSQADLNRWTILVHMAIEEHKQGGVRGTVKKPPEPPPVTVDASQREEFMKEWKRNHPWPPKPESFQEIERTNSLPPRNSHLPLSQEEPSLIIVLYVHNRPEYLKVTLEALFRVEGINQTLLIVSHDGIYPEMDSLVQGINFCQVKQIHSPFSPHLFNGTFPATSPEDCQGKLDESNTERKCAGMPDSFGNYREARIVSLKHHWWWMMNTVWDGLEETRNYTGHILFMEEDHFMFPNAILQARALIKAKQESFTDLCSFVMLAPENPRRRGELSLNRFVVEKQGNIGYTFNRTIWDQIHNSSEAFCTFDDYNWDATLTYAVLQNWTARFALRWSAASAMHIGTCGLHASGKNSKGVVQSCNSLKIPELYPEDSFLRVKKGAGTYRRTAGRKKKPFFGWGGWGDDRDQALCRYISTLYRTPPVSTTVT